MGDMLERIQEFGVVPVVALNKVEDAIPLAKALCAGGLPCAEITFRTEAAEECIKVITKEFPDMFIGAGTVLTIEQVDKALNAGAKFIVSPGFDDEIVDYCIKKNILVLPGCVTPTEVTAAIKKGLEVIKFFPAKQFGGIDTIKALAAPFGNIRFMPTGGININNLKEYLEFNKIIACGGSWMVKGELIAEGKFDVIETMTKEAVELVKKIRG